MAHTTSSAFTPTERAELAERYGRFISVPQACKLLGISPRTLHRNVDAGALTLYRIGATRTARLKLTDVLNLVDAEVTPA